MVFIGGNIDPCLYIKKSAKSIVCIALCKVDNIMVGDMEAKDDTIAALKKWVGTKIHGRATGLFVLQKGTWLGQPHPIKNLTKKFGKCD